MRISVWISERIQRDFKALRSWGVLQQSRLQRLSGALQRGLKGVSVTFHCIPEWWSSWGFTRDFRMVPRGLREVMGILGVLEGSPGPQMAQISFWFFKEVRVSSSSQKFSFREVSVSLNVRP